MQTKIDQIASLVLTHNHKPHKQWPKKIKTLVLDFHRDSGMSINRIGKLVGIQPKNIYLWSQKSVGNKKSLPKATNISAPKQSSSLNGLAKTPESQVIEVRPRGKLIHIVICFGGFEMQLRWG
jgi:hypothetical protein